MQIQIITQFASENLSLNQNYIRLLSCSLYNSLYNLKRRGEISITNRQNNASVETIPSGKYTLEGLVKALVKIIN